MKFYLNPHSYTLKYLEVWEASSDQLAIFNGISLHLKQEWNETEKAHY